MRILNTILASLLLVCVFQTVTTAQSNNISETFKKHFNETVLTVHETENVDEKRALLSESFTKMIAAIDRIESVASLTVDESEQLAIYKLDISEKLSELNGLDGFDEIADEDLNDFSDYSQDYMEQANRTITIGVGTAILILIILLLI